MSTAGAPPTTHTLSVTNTGSGSGTVTSSPAGISCGADCSQSYNEGTSVSLTATPAPGSSFGGWSGACSGTGPCTVTMSTSRSVTAAFALIPDATPPQTTITGGPSGDTADSTPTFDFASSETGSSFTCQIDGAAAVPCSSPYTTGTLAQGPHTFAVVATDAAGNSDATPATRSFTVVAPPDEDPPQTTITVGPTGDTPDATPTFEFVSDEANSTFVCQVDAALPQACTSPHTTGSLGLGPHTFSVYATDQEGNPDPTPAVRQFRVVSSDISPANPSTPPPVTPGAPSSPTPTGDLVAPAISRLRLVPAMFVAARSGPALSALVGTRLSITLSEPADVTFRVRRLRAGRSVRGRCVRPTARNRRAPSCTRRVRPRGRIVRALPAGTSGLRYRGRLAGRTLRAGRYELVCRARDAAGNLSASRRATFVILR